VKFIQMTHWLPLGNIHNQRSLVALLLGWTPPVSVDAALRQTAQAYLQARR